MVVKHPCTIIQLIKVSAGFGERVSAAARLGRNGDTVRVRYGCGAGYKAVTLCIHSAMYRVQKIMLEKILYTLVRYGIGELGGTFQHAILRTF